MMSSKPSRFAPRPITKSQVKSIHVALNRHGIDEETYREMLGNLFNVDSCLKLTTKQASTLLVRLGRPMPKKHQKQSPKPARVRSKKIPAARNVVALASPAQRRFIDDLVLEIDWAKAGGYVCWLEKNMGLKKIRTSGDAAKVIEGLKGLKRHG